MTQRSAYSLIPGDAVFIKNTNNGNVSTKTPATVTHVWSHGSTITILTSRGYVELDKYDIVEVA